LALGALNGSGRIGMTARPCATPLLHASSCASCAISPDAGFEIWNSNFGEYELRR
jgi:hypothetical protein